jgi:hypothetical protein
MFYCSICLEGLRKLIFSKFQQLLRYNFAVLIIKSIKGHSSVLNTKLLKISELINILPSIFKSYDSNQYSITTWHSSKFKFRVVSPKIRSVILMGFNLGRAVAQAVSRWLPTSAARVRFQAACGVCGGQSGTGCTFSPSTSVSPANHHYTNFFNIIITLGWHSRPIGGRSAEWTQLDSTPPLY